MTPHEYQKTYGALLMTPSEYRVALSALGLSQLAAGRWLGVSKKTAQRYAVSGPTGPACVAIRMALRFGLEAGKNNE